MLLSELYRLQGPSTERGSEKTTTGGQDLDTCVFATVREWLYKIKLTLNKICEVTNHYLLSAFVCCSY